MIDLLISLRSSSSPLSIAFRHRVKLGSFLRYEGFQGILFNPADIVEQLGPSSDDRRHEEPQHKYEWNLLESGVKFIGKTVHVIRYGLVRINEFFQT